tara:strand:- start:159 stop:371 length:213 start_codon:yes stop_codon:yes gene_type:complete
MTLASKAWKKAFQIIHRSARRILNPKVESLQEVVELALRNIRILRKTKCIDYQVKWKWAFRFLILISVKE